MWYEIVVPALGTFKDPFDSRRKWHVHDRCPNIRVAHRRIREIRAGTGECYLHDKSLKCYVTLGIRHDGKILEIYPFRKHLAIVPDRK